MFIILIEVVDVLFVISLFPILAIPSSPITSDTTNFVSNCVLFAVLFSICASNNIGSIVSPDVTPYKYHVSVLLPSSLYVITGSAKLVSPLALLPGTYVNPDDNVTSAFNVTFSICDSKFVFASNAGSTLYVTIFSFLPKS